MRQTITYRENAYTLRVLGRFPQPFKHMGALYAVSETTWISSTNLGNCVRSAYRVTIW